MKRMLSGIKPSGTPTLGNYIGAIKPFVKYQEDNELFVFIADLHALTVYQDPAELKENIDNLIAIYLAAGLDKDKSIIFRQSSLSQHAELGWILACNSNMGELSRMTQYKDKLAKLNDKTSIGTGLYVYPTLMAADILLYSPDVVPTGVDQKQHVELTRDIAERFNRVYGETFKIPEPVTPEVGAKIMSLTDPTKKMSKSESDKGTIYLFDDEKTIREKIKKAVTDSEDKVYYDPVNKPGISNLLVIMSSLSGTSIKDLEMQFKDIPNYGVFKKAVADVVVNELLTLQYRVAEIKNNGEADKALRLGFLKAFLVAKAKLEQVYKKIGLD